MRGEHLQGIFWSNPADRDHLKGGLLKRTMDNESSEIHAMTIKSIKTIFNVRHKVSWKIIKKQDLE